MIVTSEPHYVTEGLCSQGSSIFLVPLSKRAQRVPLIETRVEPGRCIREGKVRQPLFYKSVMDFLSNVVG